MEHFGTPVTWWLLKTESNTEKQFEDGGSTTSNNNKHWWDVSSRTGKLYHLKYPTLFL
jgi:hypothetical protein